MPCTQSFWCDTWTSGATSGFSERKSSAHEIIFLFLGQSQAFYIFVRFDVKCPTFRKICLTSVTCQAYLAHIRNKLTFLIDKTARNDPRHLISCTEIYTEYMIQVCDLNIHVLATIREERYKNTESLGHVIGVCHLVAIAETTIQVPYHVVNSFWPSDAIWRHRSG